MEPNRHIFWSFWAIFCLFTPLTTQKNQNFKKMSSFYTILPKTMIVRFTVPDIWCVTNVIFIFHFGLFFPLVHPKNGLKNQNKKKMKKKLLEISSL